MTRDAERVFVDSNVLLAATDPSRDTHEESRQFIRHAEMGRVRVFAAGQVFREYAVVATRPVEANGLGLDVDDAVENLAAFLEVVAVLPETRGSLDKLQNLIRSHGLKGKRIHDANLVAVMRTHGLGTIKTWNPTDFRCFEEVDCI